MKRIPALTLALLLALGGAAARGTPVISEEAEPPVAETVFSLGEDVAVMLEDVTVAYGAPPEHPWDAVDISSYDAFRASTCNGSFYDVDGRLGAQCWDGASLLWRRLGRGLSTGPEGCARECWTASRAANAGDEFWLIYSCAEIRRGDVLVFSSPRRTGHIAFADERYAPGMSRIRCYGQNQRNANFVTGNCFTVDAFPLDAFLGAFRYKPWSAISGGRCGEGMHWVLYEGGQLELYADGAPVPDAVRDAIAAHGSLDGVALRVGERLQICPSGPIDGYGCAPESVASVTQGGLVRALKPGTAAVTARTRGGGTATVPIKVIEGAAR